MFYKFIFVNAAKVRLFLDCIFDSFQKITFKIILYINTLISCLCYVKFEKKKNLIARVNFSFIFLYNLGKLDKME